MKNAEVINSYFHPKHPHEIVVVEMNYNGKPIKRNIFMEEILNNLITIPIRQIPDTKILRKAKELALTKI